MIGIPPPAVAGRTKRLFVPMFGKNAIRSAVSGANSRNVQKKSRNPIEDGIAAGEEEALKYFINISV